MREKQELLKREGERERDASSLSIYTRWGGVIRDDGNIKSGERTCFEVRREGGGKLSCEKKNCFWFYVTNICKVNHLSIMGELQPDQPIIKPARRRKLSVPFFALPSVNNSPVVIYLTLATSALTSLAATVIVSKQTLHTLCHTPPRL